MRTTTLALAGFLLSGGMAFAAAPGSNAGGAAAAPGTPPAGAITGSAPSAAGTAKFSSQADAARTCGASNVVWANTNTKAYHLEGDKYFGHTKHGAWMCRNTAQAEGYHQAGVRSSGKSGASTSKSG